MRPALYLDVDGVLNRLGPPVPRSATDWQDFTLHHGVDGFTLCLSCTMVARIRDLPADVCWLTAWRQRAPEAVAPLVHAPPWPWLAYDAVKAEAVVADQRARRRPFVWIDDVEATTDQVAAVAAGLPGSLPPHLLVRPDPLVGLTPDDLERVAAFCRDPGGA